MFLYFLVSPVIPVTLDLLFWNDFLYSLFSRDKNDVNNAEKC